MDSQFRCKCGKPMAYSNEPCKDCGSLGPHAYAGKPGPPAMTTQMPAQPKRPENIPVDRGERQPPMGRGISSSYEPADIGGPVQEKGHGARSDEASSFPVGISRRAEILNHIEAMDGQETRQPSGRPRKEKKRQAKEDWDTNDQPARIKHYESFLEEEEAEKPRKRSGGLAGTIISVVLVLALIIGALWAYSNQEEISRWLMSPTTPETAPPSDQPSNSGSGQNPFEAFLAAFGWKPAAPVSTDNTNTPAASGNQTEPVASDNAQTPATPAVPSDTAPPIITEILIKSITDHGATITWKTDELCTSRITYKTELGEPHVINAAATLTRYHKADLSGLEGGKNYYITLISRDAAGNETKQERSFPTLLSAADTEAPQLEGEPTASADETTATISWKTNEKAKSQVRYSLGTGYEFPSGFTYEYSNVHSVFLSGLSPNTEYHYQLISRDASGNVMTSGDYTFKTEPESGSAPYLGSKAPNFTLCDLQGEAVSLSQYRGKKVILNFWASWCTPCKIELPHFQTLWARYNPGADFIILAVAGSQSEESVIRDFVTDGNYTFTVLLDPNEDAFNKYELTSIPKTFFIDKDGVIRRIQQGMFTGPGEIEFLLNSY